MTYVKAHLRYYTKSKIQNRYVVELSIYEVGKSIKYPDGIKYGLICKDLKVVILSFWIIITRKARTYM